MKDFAMQLTQKCVSMGLLDESYSEWFASYYRNVNNIACWVYSVRKDGTMHKSKGVTPMQQCSFE